MIISSVEYLLNLIVYCQVSNIRCILVANQIVDNSDVVGASPGLDILCKDNCKSWRETFKFWNLVCLILEILQYMLFAVNVTNDLPSAIIWILVILNCCAEFILGNVEKSFPFLSFLKTDMVQVVITLPCKDLFIVHIHYHGCWCPGDTRSHCILSQGIDVGIMEYSGFSIRRVENAVWLGKIYYRLLMPKEIMRKPCLTS